MCVHFGMNSVTYGKTRMIRTSSTGYNSYTPTVGNPSTAVYTAATFFQHIFIPQCSVIESICVKSRHTRFLLNKLLKYAAGTKAAYTWRHCAVALTHPPGTSA